jgi:hypothetical protein
LDAIDPCKHAEKVLAIPSLLLCLFKISENGRIAYPFVGRAAITYAIQDFKEPSGL